MPPCRRVLLQEAPVQGSFGLQWVVRVLKIDSRIPEKDFYRRVAKLVPESVRVHQAGFFVPKIPYSTVWFCLVAWAQFEVKPLVDIRVQVAENFNGSPVLSQVEAHERIW